MLHIQLEPEVKQGIDMIRYLSYYPDEFSAKGAPLMIAHMQMLAALFTEAVNMVLICTQQDSLNTVVNFVALLAIASIDNYYYDSLSSSSMKRLVEEDPPVFKHKGSVELKQFKKRSNFDRLVYLDYRFFRFLFYSIYFYFSPFATPVITYLVAGNKLTFETPMKVSYN